MIAYVDEFIIYDDMQFTKRDWRNRNQIKTPHGLQWLTVPVLVKGKYYQKIIETEIDGQDWSSNHLKTISQNYKRAKYFDEIYQIISPIYNNIQFTNLSNLNRTLIETICLYLDIKTKISNSWDYELIEGKTERLANLCLQAGATEYISGPAAKNYVDDSVFNSLDIKLTWFDYNGYQEYPQLWGDFTHFVSILDMLFNCGKDSKKFMRFV
jgi:hypothetical protein